MVLRTVTEEAVLHAENDTKMTEAQQERQQQVGSGQ
jgi:hypothetical protein